MATQWLAIGAETDPRRSARQLQRSWERLLSGGALARELPPRATAGLRPTIVESWRRSLATGLDPTDSLAPIEADESEVLERWFEHPLGSLAHVITEDLKKVAEESRSVVVLTDASGLVLHTMGEQGLRELAAEQNHLVEGARWSEAADGTNGIGTALATGHAFQVFAFEHFNERHHQWICSGAPIRDPVSGQTIGLIDLSSLWKIELPRSLELVTAAARTIEQRLLEVRRDQEARLRRRYGDLMTRSTDLLVNRDGYVLEGAEPAHAKTIDVPAGGGEVVLGDGSVAVAASLGQGEAYLLRRVVTRHARSAPVEVLERAEKHLRELVAEQSALRQVATLVARESAPDQLFAAVAGQVARLFAVPHVRLVRFEPEGSVVVGGFSERDREFFPIGSRWPLYSTGAIATVRQTGRPARAEDYAHLTGAVAEVFHAAGVRSAVASPIVVEGRLWGAMVVHSRRDEPFPDSTEARLADFTALVATAIANAESRVAIARLADEQAALRRVATRVAQGASPHDLFAAVTEEVGRLLPVGSATLGRYEPGDSVITVASWSATDAAFPTGRRWPIERTNIAWEVRETRQAARIDDFSAATDPIGIAAREGGATSAVGSPIVVEDQPWGLMTVTSTDGPLPPDTEVRLASFTELVATAIANTEAREELAQLADEQAALRRVATLVARDAEPAEIFAAVSAEVDRVFRLNSATFEIAAVGRFVDASTLVAVGVSKNVDAVPLGSRWPQHELFAATRVLRTGRSARVRADEVASDEGEVAAFLSRHAYPSQVASPIVVDGQLWGALSVNTGNDLPPDTEERLERFTGLVATAIANARSRETLARLVDEQSALRRVATHIARGAPPAEVFAAVSVEVDRLLRLPPERAAIAGVVRFDPGPEHVVVGVSRTLEAVPLGSRWPPIDLYAPTRVLRTGRSARVGEGDLDVGGPEAAFLRDAGYLSQVASPILVGGQLWGAISVNGAETLPPDTEERLEKFIDLVATAIANAESREAVGALADEQIALRRVATLVAEEVAPARIFEAVCEQVGLLLEADMTALELIPGDGTATVIAVWSSEEQPVPVGVPRPLKPNSIAARIVSTHASARRDILNDHHVEVGPFAQDLRLESTVGAPVLVGGRLWGALLAGTRRTGPWAEEAETRLSAFTELVATAIANAESRDALARLADEQAALRRVATLVARDVPPGEVFDAVAMEVGKLLDADVTVVGRYDPDGAATAIGSWSSAPGGVPVGTRSALGGRNVLTLVAETKGPARVDGYDDASGEAADIARRHGWRSSIAAPISVEGRLWGVMLVATQRQAPFPAGAEERLSVFTDLVATAIANAESKSELAASRRRIVAAADEARRRIERDLHDGIQQRLIALSFRARAMTRRPPDELPGMAAELSEGLRDASDELREISRGIHPTILTEAGLGPALRALARRSDVPVDVDVRLDERLSAHVEAAAYYIASEALTNVAKHADANVVELLATHDDEVLTIEVRDDGIGGVDATRGSGILGLTDRVEALGGTISIASPSGSGTTLSVRLPVSA